MKRLAVVVICFLMLLSSVFSVYADVDKGTLLTVEISSRYTEEMASVQQAVKVCDPLWDRYIGSDREKADYSMMYQIYYLESKDIITAYNTNGTFGSNILDRYYWVVPSFENKGELQVIRSDRNVSGWDIRRGTEFQKELHENYPDVDFRITAIYGNILDEYPNANRYSFRFVYDEGTQAYLMYFISEGKEYIVPYFATDITWLSNGEIYEAGVYVDLLKENVSSVSSIEEDVSPGKNSERIYDNYLVIGTACVICIAVVAIIVARKRKKKGE